MSFHVQLKLSGLLKSALLGAALLIAICSLTAKGSDISFDGIAAGDPTTTDVVLWARAKDVANPVAANVTLKVATDQALTANVLTFTGNTDPNEDFTVKLIATGLSAGTRYYYQFKSTAGTALSDVGTFKTAFAAGTAAAVKFAFSGDADGKWRPYPVTNGFDTLALDFFAFLGDTMYENAKTTDSPNNVTDPAVNPTLALTDLRVKFLNNIKPAPNGTFSSLKKFFASQANYTLLDNHELCSNIGSGNFQAGGAPSALPFDPTNTANDVNLNGPFQNKAAGFIACQRAYRNYEPIRERTVSASGDPRTDGTQQMYLSQQWGKNLVFILTDCRSYRDIRLKTGSATGPDDTGSRADNPNRTMFGKTQLAFIKQQLLAAQANGTPWKVIAVSDPIDQVAPIGGTLGSVIAPTSDGAKSFIGGYRAERNDLLKFIADNKILNVVFLATDDHLTRVNELSYFPDPINNPTNAVRVPACFTVVTGPIGASGPDAVTDHTFSSLKTQADAYAAAQKSFNVDPIGLDPAYPGLKNVFRENDANADTLRQPVDFFSVDTFNYTQFDISADGKTMSVGTYGINSFAQNLFTEPTVTGPVRKILSFDIDASTNPNVGPSTIQTPYLIPVAAGAKMKAILSAGEAVNNVKMVGIPDGLGAFDNGDGTFTLLMNHELGNTLGAVRAHGAKGAFVSKWNINKSDLTVNSISDLIQTVNTWSTVNLNYSVNAAKAFNRFCSADLPARTALLGTTPGLGTSNRIFFNGEETTGGGLALAHVVTGTDAGKTWELPRLGKCEHENVVLNPALNDKTIAITLSDTSPTGQVYVYVGTKTNTGLDIEKAGLTNGTLYGIAVTGVSNEDRASALGAGKNVPLTFTLPSLGTLETDTDGTLLNAAADQNQVTRFARPEDGSWDPEHPNDFYFVTTDRIDTIKDGIGSQAGRSRLWRLRFNDLKNPTSGGTITMLLDGTEPHNMLDNVTVDRSGHVIAQEDVGNSAHNGKIWSYDISTGAFEIVAMHDPARFGDIGKAATSPFTQDEESSGVIDVSDILGTGWFLSTVQAHYSFTSDTSIVEGGQLLAMYLPTSNPATRTNQGKSSSQSAYLVPTASGVQTTAIMTVGDTVNKKPDNVTDYKMVGIPDGLGAFDNNDGTFTLLMNHELGSTAGIARSHGSTGAFVSKWIINKKSLQVTSVQDLIKDATSVILWDAANSVYLPGGTTQFNRFCSADLPAVSAFYNSNTMLGTQERIFMNGEESGTEGRAFAHIVTGASAGVTYELPRIGKYSHENCVANPFAQDKTIVASSDDTSPLGQVYVYIGTKTNTGTVVDQAGLTNGNLYGIVLPGVLAETIASGIGTGKGVAAPFTMANLGNVENKTGVTLDADSNAANVSKFLRPEDLCWDPNNPADLYFVTTNQLDTINDGLGSQAGRSRLWRVRFSNIATPENGGTITMLLDGTEGQTMFDNLTIDKLGRVVMCEDTGSNAKHNSKVWMYSIATGELKLVAKHDPSRFGDVSVAGSSPFINGVNGVFGTGNDDYDEESSGVVDVSSILGTGWFLIDVQAHYTDGGATISTELAEGGQLLAMYIPPTLTGTSIQGISSSQTPYVVPAAQGVKTVSIMSVGDTVNKKPDNTTDYRMVGVPDGLGAFDNGDGTFTLLANHELTATQGIARAHGNKGSFVSKWTIEKQSLKVLKVEDLNPTNTSVFLWDTQNSTFLAGGTTTYLRLCSADLPATSALYNAATGRGTQERIFLNGEENGATGRAFAHVVTGPNAGKSYELAGLGLYGHENVLACPKAQDKTICISTDDSGLVANAAASPVYVYIGNKTNTGLEVEKAGLTKGKLFAVAVTGITAEDRTTSLGAAKGTGVGFTLVASNSASLTKFLRCEDGVWDPINPADFYFVTTDRLDQVKDNQGAQVGRSRLFRMRFNDILNPEFGGTITMLLDGTEAHNMLDNMTMDRFGHILMQEDTGNAVHNAKIWLYDIVSGTLKLVAKHDPTRFGDLDTLGTSPFADGVDAIGGNSDDFDEESSGIVDASSILGPGWFLLDVQAHYTNGTTITTSTELVEGGQLVAMYVPEAATISASFAVASQVVQESVGNVTVTVNLSAPSASAVSVPYSVSGTANSADHNLVNGSIVVPAGSLTGAVTFKVTDDTLHEGNETVVVTMGTPTFAVAGGITVHTVLILDNDPALASSVLNDSVTTNEDTAVTTQNVLSNDTGVNGVAPVYAGSTLPTNGSLVDNKDGTFVYTPTTNFNGSDSFTYTVSDNQAVFKQTSPVLVTVPNATNTKNVSVTLSNGGYGSAVTPVPGVANEFYLLTDRGPNADGVNGEKIFPAPNYTPQIGRFRVEADGSMTRLTAISLKRADGTPLTGKPIPQGQTGATLETALDLNSNNLSDTEGIDSEGLVALADGTFWVSDEYGPFLVHFAADGTTLERIAPSGTNNTQGHKLPQVLAKREINRGMEGLCVTPDGTTLVGIMQSSLPNDATTRNAALRILFYTIATGAAKEYVYLVEKSSGSNNSAVSEITAVSNTEFLVLERDGAFPLDDANAVKKIFKIDITGATDVNDPTDSATGKLFGGKTLEKLIDGLKNPITATPVLTAAGIIPVKKSLFIDLMKFKSVYNHDKIEGICLTNNGKTLVVANDDDFVLGTDTAGDATPASRIVLKKSVGGVTDTSEMMLIDLATATVNVTVVPVNDVPSFTKGADQTVAEDSGAQSVTGWATAISAGPANEVSQTLTFILTNDNNALFSTQPAVDATGKLTYTPAANANGIANVSVTLKDNGGGTDTSAAQTFKITVTAVNDVPSFTKGANVTVLEDAGAQIVAGWATAISAGPADEAAQTLTFVVTNDKNSLFSVQPAISAAGTLTFTPAANANGVANVTVALMDNGGGTDTSSAQTFTITITAANDLPSFTKGADQTVTEDAGAQSVTGWATAISAGPVDEASQTLTFILTNDNNALFSAQPAVDATGKLTYTSAANANGIANVSVTLKDNGGGTDTSAAQTFKITVTAVNDVPSFTKGANVTVLEDAGAQIVAGWATAISAGPADEAAQTLTFVVTNDKNSLFSVQPAISAAGTLTFTPTANANGVANVTVTLKDNGAGTDTSASQTFTITVSPVNDVPSFTKGADQTVAESAGAQTVDGWATAISTGPADEASQKLTFIVTNDNNALFSVQPAVSATGTLTYTIAPAANGVANMSVSLKDDGGGTDTSAVQSFKITITPANKAPIVVSSATATPSSVKTNESVSFLVAASDPEGLALSYDWDFGDSTVHDLTGASVNHAYAVPGTFTVIVKITDAGGASTTSTVSVTVTAPTVASNSGLDSDSDGYSDEIEIAMGTDRFSATSTPANGNPATAAAGLTVSKLGIKLSFVSGSKKDSISLSGSVPLPAAFSKKVIFDVGGVVKSITLTDKLAFKDDNTNVKFNSSGKFSFNLKNGSFLSTFADEGFTNQDIKGLDGKVKVTLILDGKAYVVDQRVEFTAKKDKGGSTK